MSRNSTPPSLGWTMICARTMAAVVDDLEAPGAQDVGDGLRTRRLLLRPEDDHRQDVDDGQA